MKQEIVKQDGGALATNDLVKKQTVLRTDLPIPRIFMMQKGSDLVEQEKAKVGDYIRSTTGEKVGDMKTPLEIIPLTMSHGWSVEEVIPNSRSKWVRNEARTPQNEDLPWTFQEGGREHKRVKTLSLFGLLLSDLKNHSAAMERAQKTGELPDDLTSLQLLPVVRTFRSTSMKAAGASISLFFNQIIEAVEKYRVPGAAPYKYSLPLCNTTQKNDKGSFQVDAFGKATKTDPSTHEVCAHWFDILSTKLDQLKVDADVEDDGAPVVEVQTAAAGKKATGKQQF